MTNYISDLVRREDFDPDAFNLIDAGPGAGKTTFINERLHELFPEVSYENILMAESRSLTASMLDKDDDSNFSKLRYGDIARIRKLKGLPELSAGSVHEGITVATYDKLVDMVAHNNGEGDILAGVDIVVLDETHCLYTDVFISNIKAVSVWLKGLFSPSRTKRPLVIGLSATPDCFTELNKVEQNFPIHRILDRKLVKYRAKHLICGAINDIPDICKNRFKGKTIIMCEKLDDCYMLARLLGNAAVVCSARNEHITKEMIRIRRYIEENASLPDTHFNEELNKWEPLKYLIMTATGREGYNFRAMRNDGVLTDDDIQNVIVCFTDPMSIVQFAGRPRYDIPNLMVAMNPFGNRGVNNNSFRKYQCDQRHEYLSFVRGDDRKGSPWFKLISPFLEENVTDVEVLESVGRSKHSLQNEMKKMRSDSLVPEFIRAISVYISKGDSEVRVYVGDGDAAIVRAAKSINIFRNNEDCTFKRIKILLERNGYSVQWDRERIWSSSGNVYKPYYVIKEE